MNAQTYVRRSEWRKRIKEAQEWQRQAYWLIAIMVGGIGVTGILIGTEPDWWIKLIGIGGMAAMGAIIGMTLSELMKMERIVTFYQHLLDESRWD